MNLKNKKILVTGGAGFIGSSTIESLLKKGAKVVVVDNFDTGRKENISRGVKLYNLNIASPGLAKMFSREKPEFVYHFAFNRFLLKSVENPLLDMDSISGSINLFNQARKNRVKKVIFASTGFVYGKTTDLPMKETHSPNPTTPFAIAKLAVEHYLKFFGQKYGLPYVILRYATIYGRKQRSGAMADYIYKLSRREQAEIFGDGKMTRDYVYIDDVVRANLAALNVPQKYKDSIFNIGTGKETSLRELYKNIAKLLGVKFKPIYRPGRPEEQKRYFMDYSRFSKTVGWKPKIDLATGLKLILC